MDLHDKVIAVTGAGQGIGRALAACFAGAGADLALLDVQPEALGETQRQCEALGARAWAYLCDIGDETAVEQTMDAIVADAGRLDGLINNAGILRDALLVKVRDGEVVGRMSLAQWQAVIDVNLTGVFLCGRAAAERMIRLGNGGVIINISSISRAGNAGQTNYSAAKAGVAAMAVVWAQELGRYGIRAASIAPGFVATEILSAMKPEMLAKMLAPVPLQRLGEADEIAKAARFIFENDFYTGRCLELDGGLRL